MPTSTRRAPVLVALAAISLGACASDQAATTTSPPTSVIAASDATTPQADPPYATTTFTRPFQVVVPSWLPHEPTIAQPDFVTWTPTTGPDRGVRVLHPVAVYPPGSTQAVAPPANYADYILGLADHGATLSDRRTITVDGRPAALVTATAAGALDGTLGCPEVSMIAGDCFGINPDVVLRLAVIGNGDDTVLVWLREKPGTDATADVAAFEAMLDTLHFTNEDVATTTTIDAPAVEGTYTWTITADDAIAHSPNPPTSDELAGLPSVITMDMNNGHWHLTYVGPDHVVVDDEGGGTYTADSDTIVFTWRGSVLTFAYTIDDDGTIHLTAQQPMDPGDEFVWTIHPWHKVS